MKKPFKKSMLVWGVIFVTLFVSFNGSAFSLEELLISSPQASVSASNASKGQASAGMTSAGLGSNSPLSAATAAAVIPPPGSIVDPADPTGSYAIKVANNFSDLTGQTRGTFEFVEAQIRSKFLAGVPSSLVTTYDVFNNKGTLKRKEEYVFLDVDKTLLSIIITRFYDLDREVHVEEFAYIPPTFKPIIPTYTPPPELPISKQLLLGSTFRDFSDGFQFRPAPQPQFQQMTSAQIFLRQWTIWNPRGEPRSLTDISQVQSDRSFDPVTFINNRWISTERDSSGRITRVFEKNPDGSNRKVIFYNQDGSVLREEIQNPVIDPAKFLGPISAASRFREALPIPTSNEAYVRNLYLTLLGRGPDAPGLAFWTNLINTGAQNRDQVYKGLIASAEYRARIIATYYETYLGRAADAAGLKFWANSVYTLVEVAKQFVNSNEGYVVGLYRSFLARDPEPSARAHWTGRLNAGLNRYSLFTIISTSPEATNEKLVIGLYRSMFGRDPEPNGLASWTARLNAGYSRYSIWIDFYRSPEARQRRGN